MGSRDIRKREQKKTKKEAKKITAEIIAPPQVTVEVIKKGKKREGEEGE